MLLVFVACSNDRNLGSFPDGGGGAAAQGGGGGVMIVSPSPIPPHFEQVTCNVTRTECNGFAATDSASGLDGLDVNCAPGELTQPVSFQATACFLTTPTDGGTKQVTQEENDAKAACAHYCDDGYGAQHNYPLGASLNKPDSGVTCESDVVPNSIQKGANGQCQLEQIDGGDPGKVVFVNCHIGGRACNGSEPSAPDGTQYCTDTPLLPDSQETSTCYDPTKLTAEVACENSWLWPMMPPNAVNDQDWFHWVFVSTPIQEDNEADCQIQANNIAFAGHGISRADRVAH